MPAGYHKQDRPFGREELEGLMDEVFGGEVQAQRLAPLTDRVVDGVLHAASLGVRAVGQGLAVAQGLAPRHAIKQVDPYEARHPPDLHQRAEHWHTGSQPRTGVVLDSDSRSR